MKCIKSKSGKIKRVKDELAYQRVDEGNWTFCGKAEYKATQKPTIEVKTTTDDPESV